MAVEYNKLINNNSYSYSDLELAICKQNVIKVTKNLATNIENDDISQAIIPAVLVGNADIVELLLKCDINMFNNYYYPGIYRNNSLLRRYELSCDEQMRAGGKWVLNLAIVKRRLDLTIMIIEKLKQTREMDPIPLFLEILGNGVLAADTPEIFDYIVIYYDSISPTTNVKLFYSFKDHSVRAFKHWIDLLPDWRTYHDEMGYTFLHQAISYNRDDLAEILLELGADVNAQTSTRDPKTALQIANKKENNSKLIEVLLRYGAIIPSDLSRETMIVISAYEGVIRERELSLAEVAKHEVKMTSGIGLLLRENGLEDIICPICLEELNGKILFSKYLLLKSSQEIKKCHCKFGYHEECLIHLQVRDQNDFIVAAGSAADASSAIISAEIESYFSCPICRIKVKSSDCKTLNITDI